MQSVKIAELFFYFYIEIYYQFTIRVRDTFKEIFKKSFKIIDRTKRRVSTLKILPPYLLTFIN